MNLDSFDPSSPMNEEQMINLLTATIVEAKLEALQTELPMLVAARFPGEAHMADWDYIDRLACTAFGVMIGVPHGIVSLMGGPVQLAGLMMASRENKFTPESLAEKMSKGFAQNSKIMGSLINADIMQKTVRLALHDWLEDPDASMKDMETDTHFYLHAVMLTDTDLVQRRDEIQREAFGSMTPEQYAKASPEVRASIDDWKRKNGIE